MIFRFIFMLIFLSSCASRRDLSGKYFGLYALSIKDKISCHFLMKTNPDLIPTVLCHDGATAWAVPLPEFTEGTWVGAPLSTKSGTLISFIESKEKSKVSVLVSMNEGRDWDIHPVLTKKNTGDSLKEVRINRNGRLEASFHSDSGTPPYHVEQDASFTTKLSPVEIVATEYPPQCFDMRFAKVGSKVPGECLSGYLKRLLK